MYKITFVAAIVIICVNSTLASLPGSGTQQDPYRIESLADFDEFAADANYWDDYTRLETDVNLAGRTYTTAVIAPDTNNSNYYDFDGTAFTGVFDGNDHKLINLTVDDGPAGNDYLGLFGCIGEDGEVRNLGLEGGSVSGRAFVGGLMGANGDLLGDGGSITNCYSTGSVSGYRYVGGLVGENYLGIVSNCYSTGETIGDDDVGGLVGGNFGGSVSNCFWDTDTQTHGVIDSIGDNDGIVTNVAGLPTAQMQTESTFTEAGWDFVEIWNIGENQTYPYLRVHPTGDINHDGIVNMLDFAIFANHWLEGKGN